MSNKSKNLELVLPHKAPVLFAKKILSRDVNMARVSVEFPEIPSLAMLVESAAQSASAIDNHTTISSAYLVSMKNIKLVKTPINKIFEVEVINVYNLNDMKLIDFKVFQEKELISSGSLTLAIAKESFL